MHFRISSHIFISPFDATLQLGKGAEEKQNCKEEVVKELVGLLTSKGCQCTVNAAGLFQYVVVEEKKKLCTALSKTVLLSDIFCKLFFFLLLFLLSIN